MNSSLINRLRQLLPGRVSEPGSPEWESAREVFAPESRLKKPVAAVSPVNRDEVARFVKWANETESRFAVRSGGHCFDGFSVQDGAILLDLQKLNRVTLDSNNHLSAMPTARVLEISEKLSGTGRALPCGDCATVALGGLISGGGFGYASRKFGLTIDSLEEATVVCGDGAMLTASVRENAEIFWACRGGGGCAGIVTDMHFRTVPIESVTGVSIGWIWDAAEEAVFLHSQLMVQGPPELDLKLKIRTTGLDRFMDAASAGPADCAPGIPLVHIDGQFLGGEEEARDLLRPLLEHSAARNVTVQRESYHDAVLQLVPLDILRDPAPKTIRPVRVASDFTQGMLGHEDGIAIARFVERLQWDADFQGGGILIEPCDKAVHAISEAATAFPHRSAELLLEWEIFYDLPLRTEAKQRQDVLLKEVRTALGDRLTGGRYLNYPDLDDTPSDWWGENLGRLEDIAHRLDPHRVIISRLSDRGK